MKRMAKQRRCLIGVMVVVLCNFGLAGVASGQQASVSSAATKGNLSELAREQGLDTTFNPFPPIESKVLWRDSILQRPAVEIGDYAFDRILIIPKDQSAHRLRALDHLHEKVNTRVKSKFPRLRGLQVLEIPVGADVPSMIWTYVQSGLVDVAEPDFEMHKNTLPNDPLLYYDANRRLEWQLNRTSHANGHVYTQDGYQWHLKNSGNVETTWEDGSIFGTKMSTAGTDIDAEFGWSIRTSAANQIVAVIDDGVLHTHEDLSQNIWKNPGESGNGKETNGIDDDGNGYIDDVYGINPGGTSQQDKVFFQHTDGTLALWYMDGTTLRTSTLLSPSHPGDSRWRIVGAGDFNNDGKIDLLYQHEDSSLAVWYMDGASLSSAEYLNPSVPPNSQMKVASVVDLDGPDAGNFTRDGKPDILFQNAQDGTMTLWIMEGKNLWAPTGFSPTAPGGTWKVVAP